MGVDLTLLPVQCEYTDNWYSHTILPLDRNSDLFELIRSVDTLSLPEPLSCYFGRVPDGTMKDERGYGTIITDAYGSMLKTASCQDLARVILKYYQVPENKLYYNQWNLAVAEFLRTIAEETKIVLYWN